MNVNLLLSANKSINLKANDKIIVDENESEIGHKTKCEFFTPILFLLISKNRKNSHLVL